MKRTPPGTSCEWSHRAGPPAAGYVTHRDVRQVRPAVAGVRMSFPVWPSDIPPCGWTTSCLSSTRRRTLGGLPSLGRWGEPCCERGVLITLQDPDIDLGDKCPQVRLLGHVVILLLVFDETRTIPPCAPAVGDGDGGPVSPRPASVRCLPSFQSQPS